MRKFFLVLLLLAAPATAQPYIPDLIPMEVWIYQGGSFQYSHDLGIDIDYVAIRRVRGQAIITLNHHPLAPNLYRISEECFAEDARTVRLDPGQIVTVTASCAAVFKIGTPSALAAYPDCGDGEGPVPWERAPCVSGQNILVPIGVNQELFPDLVDLPTLANN